MAEIISAQRLGRFPESERVYNMKKTEGRVYETHYYILAVDAAASDTTLYTVPSGKTLYIDFAMSMTTNASIYPIGLFDSAGDSADGTAKITVPSVPSSFPLPMMNYAAPIPFSKGVTIDAADTPVNKNYWFWFNGWLV
jgi:hypothetical protein